MTNEELRATLNDLPPEAQVFAEGPLEFLFIEYVSINEDGDIILSENPS